MSENKEEEKGIIIDGVDVSTCRNITFEHHDGKVTRFIVCECGVQDVEYYNVMCADNPDCYYKQLQRLKAEYKKFSEYLPIAARLAKQFKTFEEAKGVEYDGILSEFLAENEKLKNTLKEIAEIATVWLKNDWSCYYCRKNMDEHLKQIIDRAKRS